MPTTDTAPSLRFLEVSLAASNDHTAPFVVFVVSARVSAAPDLTFEPFTLVIPGTDGRAPGPVTVTVPVRFRSRGLLEDLQLLDSIEHALSQGTLELHVTGRAWFGPHVRDVDLHLPVSRSALPQPKD